MNYTKQYFLQRIANIRYSKGNKLSCFTKKENQSILDNFLNITEFVFSHFQIQEEDSEYIRKHIVSLRPIDWSMFADFLSAVKHYYTSLEENEYFGLELPLRSIEVVMNRSNVDLYNDFDIHAVYKLDYLMSKLHVSLPE